VGSGNGGNERLICYAIFRQANSLAITVLDRVLPSVAFSGGDKLIGGEAKELFRIVVTVAN
jgi:hypothetical protein